MAIRALKEIGELEYARRVADGLSEEAGLLPVAELLSTRLTQGDYPPGMYGRAWVTARELVAAVGWERVKLLAGSFDEWGRPDVVAWVGSLLLAEQARVEAVLGAPSPDWV